MECLFEDMLLLIFNNLTLEDIVACQRVCNKFHYILKDRLSKEQLQKDGLEYSTPYSIMYYSREMCIMCAIINQEHKLALYELKNMQFSPYGRSKLLNLALKHSVWDVINYIHENDTRYTLYDEIKFLYYEIRDGKLDLELNNNIKEASRINYAKLLYALHTNDRALFDELWEKALELKLGIGVVGNKIAKKYDKKFNNFYPNLASKLSKEFSLDKNIISIKNITLDKFIEIYASVGYTVMSKLLYNCISHNRIDIFKYIIDNNIVMGVTISICYALAANKQLTEFMKYIISLNREFHKIAMKGYFYNLHPNMIYQVYCDGYFTKSDALDQLNRCINYPYHASKVIEVININE